MPLMPKGCYVTGNGPITALAFKTAVEVPERFARSKTVGAHFGLTPRKYSSGQIDYQGHFSKCGVALVRTTLCGQSLVRKDCTTRSPRLRTRFGGLLGLAQRGQPTGKRLGRLRPSARAELRLETINLIKPCHEHVRCDGRHSARVVPAPIMVTNAGTVDRLSGKPNPSESKQRWRLP